MLVISQNLSGMVRASGLCDPALLDEFSLRILLDRQVRRMRRPDRPVAPVVYDSPYHHDDYFDDLDQVARDLTLAPGDRVLACSQDAYTMPDCYFGLVQTKGSLARLFVSATCNDGQIEPGYSGRITLEIVNHAAFPVTIPVGAAVAQLFVFRCSTSAETPYRGRYQGAAAPTLAALARSST